jgi:hypothetical protein
MINNFVPTKTIKDADSLAAVLQVLTYPERSKRFLADLNSERAELQALIEKHDIKVSERNEWEKQKADWNVSANAAYDKHEAAVAAFDKAKAVLEVDRAAYQKDLTNLEAAKAAHAAAVTAHNRKVENFRSLASQSLNG